MKTGTRVFATMPAGSCYRKVVGTVTGVKNGWVTLDVTEYVDRWSTNWVSHPTSCALAAPLDNVAPL